MIQIVLINGVTLLTVVIGLICIYNKINSSYAEYVKALNISNIRDSYDLAMRLEKDNSMRQIENYKNSLTNFYEKRISQLEKLSAGITKTITKSVEEEVEKRYELLVFISNISVVLGHSNEFIKKHFPINGDDIIWIIDEHRKSLSADNNALDE